jgi:predicted ATPase
LTYLTLLRSDGEAIIMLKEVRFSNWKSFSEAVIPIEQLTILIGTNASGKSNALDALEFLSRVANSIDITSAITGDLKTSNLRGGIEWVTHRSASEFSLTAVLAGEDERTDYEYTISITTNGQSAELLREELTRIRYQGKVQRRLRLFWTDAPDDDAPGMIARLYNTKSGTKQPVRRNLSVLSQLEIYPVRDEIQQGISYATDGLRSIFILDPNPSAMRAYSRPTEGLAKDGSNVAGVLVALPVDQKTYVEAKLSTYLRKIPERDIVKVWAETVDRHGVDAMLYCREKWTETEEDEVDARGLSDGTLRFIAVLVAILTQPEGSLIIIEEIDNGLHPSRAVNLLEAIRSIGEDRKIDLLITTHNVALLDALPPGVIGSVAVASRNASTGESEITVLHELPHLARLVSEGTLGQLAAKGRIEAVIKSREKNG